MKDETSNNPLPANDGNVPVIGSAVKLTEGQIAAQIEQDDDEDAMWNDDDDFECCDNCDLPDACADFGCAIKAGIRKPVEW